MAVLTFTGEGGPKACHNQSCNPQCDLGSSIYWFTNRRDHGNVHLIVASTPVALRHSSCNLRLTAKLLGLRLQCFPNSADVQLSDSRQPRQTDAGDVEDRRLSLKSPRSVSEAGAHVYARTHSDTLSGPQHASILCRQVSGSPSGGATKRLG